MKKIYVLLLIVVFFSCDENKERTTHSETQITVKEDKETLRYLKEVEWPKAYREQDTLLLDRILGNDFQMIDQSGFRTNKQDELNWIKENGTSYDSFNYEIKRLEVYKNGMAIVSGTGHIFSDSTETIYQSSNILIKRKGIWKAIASHVSGVKELD